MPCHRVIREFLHINVTSKYVHVDIPGAALLFGQKERKHTDYAKMKADIEYITYIIARALNQPK